MPEFLQLAPPKKALNKFLTHLPVNVMKEAVKTSQAFGRVTAEDMTAPHPLPEFRKSTVDGYAVKAEDTFAASDSLPVYLTLKGELPMGEVPGFGIAETECALIHTGGMLPPGANAVVMVEFTQQTGSRQIEILRSVAEKENAIEVGEDISQGEVIIPQGRRLRAADIGGLMALGMTEIPVAKKPAVGILSSGDEVIPPHLNPRPGQVRDVNTYTLRALVEDIGGDVKTYQIAPDHWESMLTRVSEAKEENDLVIITAGSSASSRDLTADVIDAQGEPGVLIHGVNVKPGKPTIFGVADQTAFVGLPGNPVSALVIAEHFVKPAIEALLDLREEKPSQTVQARLSINLSSKTGREHYVPVKLTEQEDGYRADPVFGKSNLIFLLVRADGLVKIPSEASGMSAGEKVFVTLF
ncbi:MAG: molybdopterin-binding protein [Anaerolineales bacterium]